MERATEIRGVAESERQGDVVAFTIDVVAPAELERSSCETNIAAAVVDRDYARADLEARGLDAVNRVAPHAYTSEEDIDRFLDAVSVASRRSCWRNAS